ncbi:MAG: TonB-dependent receptor, partial [Pseudomonadota bacterium]
MSRRNRVFAYSIAAAIVVGPALAQSDADASNVPGDTPDDVIVVTAQFRQQNILEVPIAITAYDNDALDQLGVDEFSELANFVPGLIVQEQSVNNPGFVIRGITSSSGASNIEPRVSVFQNGVSIARSRGSLIRLLDVERVEVLKGPQGTLFGRSAEIGAVHIITNKPQNAFAGKVFAGTGNFDEQRYEGFINIPIIDDALAFRAAGSFNRRAGYIDNPLERDLNGVDTLTLRGSLRARPTDNITIDLIANYTHDEPPGTAFQSGVIPALGGDTDPQTFATLSTFGGFLDADALGVDRDIFDVTAIIDWKINDSWGLTSTTAYREFSSLDIFDPDGSAFEIFAFAEDSTAEQWSADFRFSYNPGGRFRGFFGGGLFLEEGQQLTPLGLDVISVSGLFGSLGTGTPPENGISTLTSPDFLLPLARAYLAGEPLAVATEIAALGTVLPQFEGVTPGVYQTETVFNAADNSSFDVFAETAFDITDRLTLTLGGRYTNDRKETQFFTTVSDPNPQTASIIGMPGLIVAETGTVRSSDDQAGLQKRFGGFVWRAVLNYEFDDGKFVYFNYSRGRRPQVIQDEFGQVPEIGADGMPTGNNVVDGEFEIVPAETVSSYEIGAKGAFWGNRVKADLAAYFYDYTNFQTGVNVAGPGEPPNFDILNGGTAEAYGVELGVNAQAHDGLSVFLTYGYNHGRFDEVGPDGSAQEFGGNRFRLSPDHSLSVGFNYERASPIGRFFVTPTYTYKSSVFFEDENQTQFDIVTPAGDVL